MNRKAAFLFLFICCCCSRAGAQSNGRQAIPDIHKLSPVDSALLEVYKDSFQTDLMNFLDIFSDPKISKRDTTVFNMDRSSHVEVALGFASRIMVYGRDEGVTGVGFFPSLAYYHKYGFFVGLALAFYTDPAITSASPVPATVPAAGFQHTFFKRWFLEAAYARTFLGYGSVESKNMLNNDFMFTTSVNMWKRLILSFSAYIDWSSLHQRTLPSFEKRAFEIPISLRKDFVIYKFIGAKVFTITPAITTYFATDNYAFIRQRAVAEQTGSRLSIYTSAVDHFFGFVDVEPSVSFDWRIRNVDIFALPALAIPFNEFNYETSTRTANPHEYKFYVQAGVKYLFHVPPIRKKK